MSFPSGSGWSCCCSKTGFLVQQNTKTRLDIFSVLGHADFWISVARQRSKEGSNLQNRTEAKYSLTLFEHFCTTCCRRLAAFKMKVVILEFLVSQTQWLLQRTNNKSAAFLRREKLLLSGRVYGSMQLC